MKKFEAGIWEQSRNFVAWSRHATFENAQKAARRYAKQQKQQVGGALSWSGGVRRPDGVVVWYRADGSTLHVDLETSILKTF